MAFKYYTPLTVTSNSSLLPSTQTNFQLLLKYSDARFKSVGNGGHVESASGFDIRPYDATGTIALDFELVTYSASGGTFQIWVNVPSLSAGLRLILKYGDTSLTSDGSNKTNVWGNNGYIAVYHHEEATAADAPDSSGNGNTATHVGSPASVSAQIDKGISATGGASDYFTTPRSIFGTNSSLTFSGWFNPASAPEGSFGFSKQDFSSPFDYDFAIYFDQNSPNKIRTDLFNAGGTRVTPGTDGLTYSANTWYHVKGVYNGTDVRCYVNGSLNGTAAALTGNVRNTVGASINTGVQTTTTAWNGKYDEIRLKLNVADSADWTTAEYNNQNDPTTFVALGAEASIVQSVDFPNPIRRAVQINALSLTQNALQNHVIRFADIETGNINQYDASQGSPVVITSPVHQGTYALKLPNTGSTQQVEWDGLSLSAVGMRVWVRLSAWPSAYVVIPVQFYNGSATLVNLFIAFDTHKLGIGSDFSLTGTTNGTYILALNTWYEVSCVYDAAAGGVIKAWVRSEAEYNAGIAATLDISLTHSGANGNVALAATRNDSGLTLVDLYIDDSILTDTADQPPGADTPLNPPSFPRDFPNPKGRPFPIEDLTWLQQTDLGLLHKDKFFDAPGQGPNYDWPVPKGKPYSVDVRTWIQTLAVNLRSKDKFFSNPGRGPTYDWTNPLRPRRSIDLYSWTLGANLNLFVKVDPRRQLDWPNPVLPRRAPEYSLATNPNIYPSGKPFKTDDYPNPLPYRRPVQDWIAGTNINLLVPFALRDWPNPLPYRRGQDFILPTNPTIYPSGKPFKQDDWPNPLIPRQPADTRTFTLITNPNLYQSGKPPVNYDWPNPRGPQQPIENKTFLDPLNPLQIGQDKFFTSPGSGPAYDYPNPRVAARPAEGFTGASNPNLITVVIAPVPFNQDDWPNPAGSRRGPQDWNIATNPNLYRSGKPFLQTEWPNPTLATVRRSDWIQITDLNRYPSEKPFKRDDWQNPLGPRRKPDLTNFLLPRNFEFFPPFVDQFIVQDTPTLAPVIGVYNSAFLLLVASSTATAQAGLESQAQVLSAQSTVNAPRSLKTNLIIFTANDKKVGD